MRAGNSILVLGGSGLLGQAVTEHLRREDRPFDAPPRAILDITDAAAIEAWLERMQPGAVINAAAYSDVTRAERADQHPAVFRLNRDGPGRLARACHSRGIPLLFVSTDFVFDGRRRRPYVEQDTPAPLQVYGASKLAGERAVLAAHPDALIVRTSTLFGPARGRRPHYVEAILRQARRGERIAVVRQPIASPTYTPDLAAALVELIDADAHGLVHAVNTGQCSRLELAREAVRLAGTGNEVVERPEPAPPPRRPAYSVLGVSRLERLTGHTPRAWNEALAAYLEQRQG